MAFTVYMHTFPNGKRYIGCTSMDVKKRWASGHGYNKNIQMFNDILLFGWNNIKHEVLLENLSYKEALKNESSLIIQYKTYDSTYGYNISQGNAEGAKYHSDEGIEHIRESMHTRTVSAESREKMSIAKKGTSYHTQKHSAITKEKISQNRKGKTAKENHPMARAVYCVELDKTFSYAKLAELETGVLRSHISQVCKGKRKTAGKMHWKYADEIIL